MPLKPSFFVWTLCVMSMSEIKISTTMPANNIRQKLAVSSEVFLSLVCKNIGYFYIVAAKMLPILPWQCCRHKTQMQFSLRSSSFFFNNPSITPSPDLTKSSQPSLKNWTSCSFGGVEDVDAAFASEVIFSTILSLKFLKSFYSFLILSQNLTILPL